MALNSRQKRAAVIGVARIWYRNSHPSGVDAAQRASIGQVYPVATFADALPPVAPVQGSMLAAKHVRRVMHRRR